MSSQNLIAMVSMKVVAGIGVDELSGLSETVAFARPDLASVVNSLHKPVAITKHHGFASFILHDKL